MMESKNDRKPETGNRIAEEALPTRQGLPHHAARPSAFRFPLSVSVFRVFDFGSCVCPPPGA
jgi:hypothetical protein